MEDLKIYKTTQYSVFQPLRGNRRLYQNQVAAITKSVARKNMLSSRPILVNEKMEVIDGQHRLEVAKVNNLPIYYTKTPGLTLQDVQVLNSTSKNWSGADYLNSYADQGIEEYVYMRDLLKKHPAITISNMLHILTLFSHHKWESFKMGKLRIHNREVSDMILEEYLKMQPLVEPRIFNDREFLFALFKLSKIVGIDELIANMTTLGEKIEAAVSTRDYLRRFEEIINYRKRSNYVRLIGV